MKKCEHLNFICHNMVRRITETEGGPAIGFVLEITVACNDCGTPFKILRPDGSTVDTGHAEITPSEDWTGRKPYPTAWGQPVN